MTPLRTTPNPKRYKSLKVTPLMTPFTNTREPERNAPKSSLSFQAVSSERLSDGTLPREEGRSSADLLIGFRFRVQGLGSRFRVSRFRV